MSAMNSSKTTDKEIWLPAKFGGVDYAKWYEVSSFGRARSIDRIVWDRRYGDRILRGRMLRQQLDRYGYPYVVFSKANRTKTIHLHLIVARLFLCNPQNKPQINHWDTNKQNNHMDNLVWSTDEENKHHAVACGLYPSKEGSKTNGSILSHDDVRSIRLRLLGGERQIDIAHDLGVTPIVIANIRKGKTWKHVI